MSEKAFGLSVNEIMAYAAVANVLLVLVLTSINTYYAWHAKRQADASRDQVNTFNRQAEIAAATLSILRKQIDQQHRADMATVTLQLKVGIHVIEDWLKRIASDRNPQLPDQIVILPSDFSNATQRANALDQIVAENMGAASLYVTEAETNIRILRDKYQAQADGWKEVQDRALNNLNIAKYKLNVARTRWETTTQEQR